MRSTGRVSIVPTAQIICRIPILGALQEMNDGPRSSPVRTAPSSQALKPLVVALKLLALVVVAAFVAGCGSEEEGLYEETYDSYFRSFSSDYDPADSIADLADQSEVVTKATLVDVEEGRIKADADTKPELDPDKPVPAEILVEVNLVFETADGTRYYVGLFRPNDSSVAKIRSVMPIGAASVIYLQPNHIPVVDAAGRWFNVREDGNEWLFTTPQGWILDHPEREIVSPLEGFDDLFADMPTSTGTLDDWLPEQTAQQTQDLLE